MPPPKAVQESEAYEKLVLSLKPVVYYRMEQPKDEKDRFVVFDSSGGGHHGKLRLGIESQTSPYVAGRFGDALWLRGPLAGDRVIVPDYPKATGDQLTVSAWVLATGRPGWAMIACNWSAPLPDNSDRGQFHLGLYRRDGDLFARVIQPDGKQAQVREGDLQPLPLFSWQHVALVVNENSLSLYRNGRLVSSIDCAGMTRNTPTAALGIGCRTNATGTDAITDTPSSLYWQGRIDELAIFNQALSPVHIEQIFHGISTSAVNAVGQSSVDTTEAVHFPKEDVPMKQ